MLRVLVRDDRVVIPVQYGSSRGARTWSGVMGLHSPSLIMACTAAISCRVADSWLPLASAPTDDLRHGVGRNNNRLVSYFNRFRLTDAVTFDVQKTVLKALRVFIAL